MTVLIRVVGQGGVNLFSGSCATPAPGALPAWVYLGGPVGAHVFSDHTVRVSFGVVNGNGIGGVYFDYIEVSYTDSINAEILPRADWSAGGNVIRAGVSGNYAPPRSSLRIRPLFAYHKPQRTASVVVGGIIIRLPTGLRGKDNWRAQPLYSHLLDGTSDPYSARLFTGHLGLWHPIEDPIAGEGGGWGIEPISGWNGDSVLDILRHDLTMERHGVDCLDMATGQPVPYSPALVDSYYTLARSWSKVGQLKPFCDPFDPANIYDDRRKPKKYNQGACAYEDCISGFYSALGPGFLPHDGQHLLRALRHARAAAHLYGDECAAFDLGVIAADCRYAWHAVPTVQRAVGSSSVGRREWAEVVEATGWKELAQAGATAQMLNGGIMRCASDVAWGFIPNPWIEQTESGHTWPPIPTHVDVEQSYERWVSAHALASQGFWEEADRAVATIFLDAHAPFGPDKPSLAKRLGYVPKWFGVADLHGQPHRSVSMYAQWPDYMPWIALGLMANMNWERFKNAMLLIATPTQGRAVSLADLKNKLVAEGTNKTGVSQIVGALAAVEAHA